MQRTPYNTCIFANCIYIHNYIGLKFIITMYYTVARR